MHGGFYYRAFILREQITKGATARPHYINEGVLSMKDYEFEAIGLKGKTHILLLWANFLLKMEELNKD